MVTLANLTECGMCGAVANARWSKCVSCGESLTPQRPSALSQTPGRPTDWFPDDWQALYEERASIAEHDGGLSRPDAEAQALGCCVVAWMNMYPVASDPNRCAHCGEPESTGAQVIPFGDGPVWLHCGCWRMWWSARENEAIRFLRMSGVHPKADA